MFCFHYCFFLLISTNKNAFCTWARNRNSRHQWIQCDCDDCCYLNAFAKKMVTNTRVHTRPIVNQDYKVPNMTIKYDHKWIMQFRYKD